MVNNSDRTIWFSFTARETAVEIYNYESAASPGTVATEIDGYAGGCGSLIDIASTIIDYTKYGQRQLKLENLTVGNTYYVKMIAARSNCQLNVSFTDIGSSSMMAPCANPSPLIHYTVNTNINSNSIPVGASVTVDQNVVLTLTNGVVFNNCKILMGKSSKIIAQNGLIIRGGTRINSCSAMWEGIDFLNGNLTIYENSLISDAKIAVNIIGGQEINIYNAIFNRNNKSIAYNAGILCGINFFPIYNTIFTSRDFSLNFYSANPSISVLKSINPGTGVSYLESYSPVGLLNTNIQRPFAGISDNHTCTGYFSIGKLPLGTSQNNIFEHMDFGIISSRTQTYCINNTFQFMPLSNTNNPVGIYSHGGIGILADAGNTYQGNAYGLAVGANVSGATNNTNVFFNCWQGISSSFYSNNIIQYNSFSSNDINSSSYQSAAQLLPSSGGSTIFTYNSISDLRAGTNCFISSPTFKFINFKFSSNIISVGPLANQSGGTAMTFGGISSLTSTSNAYISGNEITEAGTGILLNTFKINPKFDGVQISANNIYLVSALTSAGNGKGGIVLNSSNFIHIEENHIYGDYTSNATNKFGCGMHLFNSTDCLVNCNHVTNVRQCFIFEGSCYPVITAKWAFMRNEMSNCRDGLVLLNGGAIRQIGSPTTASDNKWLGTGFFDNSQTLADLSNYQYANNLSYFYVQQHTAEYEPFPNKVALGTSPLYFLNPMYGIASLGEFCNSTQPSTPLNSDDELKKLLADASDYVVLGDESEWLNKKYAFETLSFDPEYSSLTDVDLINFKNSMQGENIEALVWTEEMLKQYDYYFAKYLNDGVTPANMLEQNQKTFNKYYILWCENPDREFTDSEINDLFLVANQCANIGGTAVLHAQQFLDNVLYQNGTWNTNCPIPASAMRKATIAAAKDKENSIEMPSDYYLKLNCNPCNENIIFTLSQFDVASVFVTDLLGKKITTARPTLGLNKIDLTNFKNGVYFLNLNLSNGKTITKKIVVAHQ